VLSSNVPSEDFRMNELALAPLKAWETFYVIVGSSAGALTGLQFVVLTLIAEVGAARGKESISAFGTPNVVHFCAALLAASILSVPWPALRYAGVAVAGCGVLGIIYSGIVLRRAVRQRIYTPVLEDWIWHIILPALAYSALFVSGWILGGSPGALFAIGAAVLLLVFIGIHNAWDTVTCITLDGSRLAAEANAADPNTSSPPPADAAGASRARKD
jgi:hypothetical protein